MYLWPSSLSWYTYKIPHWKLVTEGRGNKNSNLKTYQVFRYFTVYATNGMRVSATSATHIHNYKGCLFHSSPREPQQYHFIQRSLFSLSYVSGHRVTRVAPLSSPPAKKWNVPGLCSSQPRCSRHHGWDTGMQNLAHSECLSWAICSASDHTPWPVSREKSLIS